MTERIKSPKAILWLVAMVLTGSLIFTLSLSLLMVPYSRVIEENGGKDLTCLQIPFTKSRAATIINSYNSEARSAARSLHLPGDLLFPLGYSLLYSGLIGLITRGQEGHWLRIGMIIMFFPFVAMVFDWIENTFILRMLNITTEHSTDAISAWMPAAGGFAGSIKYLLLSLLTPLFGMVLIIQSLIIRRPRPTMVLGVTYLIAFGMFAFSLFQFFTDVTPCLRTSL